MIYWPILSDKIIINIISTILWLNMAKNRLIVPLNSWVTLRCLPTPKVIFIHFFSNAWEFSYQHHMSRLYCKLSLLSWYINFIFRKYSNNNNNNNNGILTALIKNIIYWSLFIDYACGSRKLWKHTSKLDNINDMVTIGYGKRMENAISITLTINMEKSGII